MLKQSIVTRTGDKGETGLFGGHRISKASSRLHAYGTVDELNAVIGVVLAEDGLPAEIAEHLLDVQRLLFRVGADLATPEESSASTKRITMDDVHQVEHWIASLEQVLPALQHFILPSGSRMGALLHQARTVCRRAERWVVDLRLEETGHSEAQIFLNRLSDYLFLGAREVNRRNGSEEVEV